MALKAVSIVFLCASFHIGFIDAFRPDYTYLATTNSFYKYHKEIANWNDAVTKCKSEDTILYYPENEAEHMQVKSVLQVSDTLWIGISDLRETNVYETNDGRPISQVYNKWHRGQPSGNEDHCLEISSYDNTLYTDHCRGVQLPYICRKKATIPIQDVTMEV